MIDQQSRKLVVFSGQLTYSTRQAIVEIDKSYPDVNWLIVLHSPRKSLSGVLRNQWKLFQKNGWRWIPHAFVNLISKVIARFQRAKENDFPGYEFQGSPISLKQNWKIYETTDLHGEETLRVVREHHPDLGIALSAPILREPLFAIPRLGTINLHKGKVPEYRGMPPAFWELWNGESSVGCTVHRVEKRLDAGEIIQQSQINKDEYSTCKGLQLQLDELGVQLLRESVMKVLDGTSVYSPQPAGGHTYRQPTLSQINELRRRTERLLHRSESAPKRALKMAVGSFAFHAYRRGLIKLLAPRVTILLYHHVTDNTRDSVSIGIEQFDRQMFLLRKYCHPISITDLLDENFSFNGNIPMVAVTFDDGYLDNFENAVPILKRHRIPAAFFVSTGIVNTDRRFPHDIRRGNRIYPNMTWEQLRLMQSWGFVVGSHTVNHIDCARVSSDELRHELETSRDDLLRELDLRNPIFAYPYGRRDNMTSQGIEMAKQAGYIACLSAYGGSNNKPIDRYNILRKGIHWEFSDQEFLFACTGLR